MNKWVPDNLSIEDRRDFGKNLFKLLSKNGSPPRAFEEGLYEAFITRGDLLWAYENISGSELSVLLQGNDLDEEIIACLLRNPSLDVRLARQVLLLNAESPYASSFFHQLDRALVPQYTLALLYELLQSGEFDRGVQVDDLIIRTIDINHLDSSLPNSWIAKIFLNPNDPRYYDE